MNRSPRELLELGAVIVIGVVAVAFVVWLIGWILGLAGTILTALAELLWALFRFVLPVALVVGAVWLGARYLRERGSPSRGGSDGTPGGEGSDSH
jgi:membrane protein implicated in regulation of membrane protease activity